MEYPFPPNTNAQLAAAWNEAANQIDADNSIEFNDAVTECLQEANEITAKQETQVTAALRSYMHDIVDSDTPYYVLVNRGWHLIMEISNYIRCCSSLGDFDGEMYGLQVLMDFLADDSDE